jgi:hypothetical protein
MAQFRRSFEREEVVEGGLRSLDLRRHHRFLSDEGVDEPVERGDHLAREIEARERVLGAGEDVPQSIGRKRWIRRREWVRDERGRRLAGDGTPSSLTDDPRHVRASAGVRSFTSPRRK